MKMSDEKKQEFRAKIKYVEEMIREVEKQANIEVLDHWCICGDTERYYASFSGITEMLYYDVPDEIFMVLSPKELVIEIMRALTIEFNEYENQ